MKNHIIASFIVASLTIVAIAGAVNWPQDLHLTESGKQRMDAVMGGITNGPQTTAIAASNLAATAKAQATAVSNLTVTAQSTANAVSNLTVSAQTTASAASNFFIGVITRTYTNNGVGSTNIVTLTNGVIKSVITTP